jgi:competence protein ComEA
MSDVTISPSLAALAGAATVALAVAFVLRPAQLAPHPESTLSAPPEAERSPVPPPRTLVYVAGAVVHPGVYALRGDARAQDALAKAGGATRDADLVAVNLAARVADGDEIAVPHQGEARPPVRSAQRRTPAGKTHRRRSPRRAEAAAGPVVDLNAADARTLSELPGIGPVLAERIVDFRALNGPFASADGLADVEGITPQRLDALLPRLTAGR